MSVNVFVADETSGGQITLPCSKMNDGSLY